MIIAKCVTLEAGYNSEQERMIENNFTIGNEYVVEAIIVGRCHTDIYLYGHERPFNSVFFDFYEDGEEIDIYSDKRFTYY